MNLLVVEKRKMSRVRPSDEDDFDDDESEEETPNKKISEDSSIVIPIKQTPDFEAMQIENNINLKKILKILESK